MVDLNVITQALISGDEDQVTRLVQKAVDENVAPKEILNEGLIKGMDIVGERMEDGDMFIPEVLRSAKTMKAAVTILKPLLGEGESATSGKVVIGTVKGDLHDIGKNLVGMMLESAGFEITDLGVDVSPEQFVQAVKDQQPQVVGLSALDHHNAHDAGHYRCSDGNRSSKSDQGCHRRCSGDSKVRR